MGGAVALAIRGDFPSPREVNKATVGRSKLVTGGLELWTERPLHGFGSGSFQEEYKRERDLTRPNAVTASHTTPVTVAAEQGVIGLAVYVALVVIALMTLLTSRSGLAPARRDRRRLRGARDPHDGLRRLPRGPDDVGAAGCRRGAGRASELLDRELVVLGDLKEARVVVDDLLRAVLHHHLALV